MDILLKEMYEVPGGTKKSLTMLKIDSLKVDEDGYVRIEVTY